MRGRGWTAALGALAVTGALVTGCGAVNEVPAAPAGGPSRSDSGTPASSPSPSPDPALAKRLEAAREAKERERREPNYTTVCLNPDGTVKVEIDHARAAGAPPLTQEDKDRVCANAPTQREFEAVEGRPGPRSR